MTSPQLPKLTTTSFALLGLLSRRPWSAYELTQYMRNSVLRAIWPRAESHLYSEPKLLQKRGFAISHERLTGARKRTVYTITESGRAALHDWLQAERVSEFRFEYELLVRLAFAESASVATARVYLQQVRAEVICDASEALAAVDAELADLQELQARPGAAYSGAIIQLIVRQLDSRLRWADNISQRLSSLQTGSEQGGQEAQALYRDARDRLLAILSRQ